MTSEGLTQERSGFTGCHNVNQTIPTMEWSRTLDLVNSDGVLNDEVAVAPPAILNVDGQGAPELLVDMVEGCMHLMAILVHLLVRTPTGRNRSKCPIGLGLRSCLQTSMATRPMTHCWGRSVSQMA